MAVRMMCDETHAGEPNVETVRDYPGHEDGLVSHDRHCPKRGVWDRSGCLSGDCLTSYQRDGGVCGVFGPLYMRTTHTGLVLSTGERNGYDDSDFTVTVWDVEKGMPETFMYATTRGWTYPNSATPDASPEIIAAYNAYMEGLRIKARNARLLREAQEPRKGRTVKVVKGRKIPLGTLGVVFWSGPDKYASRYAPPDPFGRIGLTLQDGSKVFTAGTNVEVVEG